LIEGSKKGKRKKKKERKGKIVHKTESCKKQDGEL
jgi:hypothetical protein